MSINEKRIFVLDDFISFRKCTLYDGRSAEHGDCTCFHDIEENWKHYYACNQDGIHLHCTKHPAIELDISHSYGTTILSCPKCNDEGRKINDINEVIRHCLRMLNMDLFKDAQLVRLDDWYYPEVKKRVREDRYWITADVKTDRDGDTIIVLYVGLTGDDEKAQFFVKPEKLQLTTDHKDMDPARVLSSIAITLRDRTLRHDYD